MSSADLPPEWIARTKYAASQPGVAMRVDGAEIQCYLHHSKKEFMPLLLPDGTTSFLDEIDAFKALSLLGLPQLP